jgi:DNA N-6-adenine-methyltransferase (Dam)
MHRASIAAAKSSAYRHWGSPELLVTYLHRFGVLELDPCSNDHSIVNARVTFRYKGGLDAPWLELAPALAELEHFAYVNSSYGRELALTWVPRCVLEHRAGVEILQLVPARPDTAWWREAKAAARCVAVLHGRLRFIRPRRKRMPALFPSALFYYGQRQHDFEALFSEIADVYHWRRRAARPTQGARAHARRQRQHPHRATAFA